MQHVFDMIIMGRGSAGCNCSCRRCGGSAFCRKGDIIMLEIGMKAPDFTLQDKDGKEVSFSDFSGKKVVLYFYPRENTPGCTRQVCAFAGLYKQLQEKGVEVIGVSKDSVSSHQKFAEKHSLNFIFLSDPELDAIKKYGVWQEKNFMVK